MKYLYLIIIPVMFIIGCSSSESERMNKEMIDLKKSIDSIKTKSNSIDRTLDSLQSESKAKEEKMIFLQKQLDSLNKNLQEEGLK